MEASDAEDSFGRNHVGVSDQVPSMTFGQTQRVPQRTRTAEHLILDDFGTERQDRSPNVPLYEEQ
jgi:hypothetical protein